MRALIVGFGAIGRRHAANLLALRPETQLQVLLPAGSGSAKHLVAGAAAVHELDAAIRAKPNLAILCSPSAARLEYLLPLLEAGIPCYVEKPLVASIHEARELRAYIARRPALPAVSVGCNLRLLPSLRKVQGLLSQGAIGTVVRAALAAGQWLPDWRPGADYRTGYSARQGSGGGVVLDLIHEIDMARWLFGELDLVGAAGGKFSRLEIDSEDTACILLGRAARPPVVSISLDYVSRRYLRRYEIVGDEGTLIWSLDQRELQRADADGTTLVDGDGASFDLAATYVAALQNFLDCLSGGTPFCGIEDGLASAELALRARGEVLKCAQ